MKKRIKEEKNKMWKLKSKESMVGFMIDKNMVFSGFTE